MTASTSNMHADREKKEKAAEFTCGFIVYST